MIAVIRIRGMANTPGNIKRTMHVLRLRKKYVCVLLDESKQTVGMLEKAKGEIAYGIIDKETLKQLILKRGRMPGDKPITLSESQIDTFAENFIAGKAKLDDIKIKPFFRLHPPRHGFKKSIKLLWPDGMLGNQGDKINETLGRML